MCGCALLIAFYEEFLEWFAGIMIKKKFLNVQFLNSSQIPKQKDQAVHFYFI